MVLTSATLTHRRKYPLLTDLKIAKPQKSQTQNSYRSSQESGTDPPPQFGIKVGSALDGRIPITMSSTWTRDMTRWGFQYTPSLAKVGVKCQVARRTRTYRRTKTPEAETRSSSLSVLATKANSFDGVRRLRGMDPDN